MAHDGANRNDHKLLRETLESIPIQRPEPTEDEPQGICLDKAYDNIQSRDTVAKLGLTPHIRARGEELKEKVRTPGWRARRWVVEACHSWLNRNRALVPDLLARDRALLDLLAVDQAACRCGRARQHGEDGDRGQHRSGPRKTAPESLEPSMVIS